MMRHAAVVLLPALLLLLIPTLAHAQRFPPPPPQTEDDLSGTYRNQSNGGECLITRSGRVFTFVNEKGSRAKFRYVAPDRLEQVAGDWDPNVVASVSRNRFGQFIIRFDAPRTRPGYWMMTGN